MNNQTPDFVNLPSNKAVFLDRDGVLNKETGDYVWQADKLEIIEGVAEALAKLKQAGYFLIVITNQAGICKGLYTPNHVWQCHQKIQQSCQNLLDYLYFCPYTDSFSKSLSRKPGTLMLERGIARFKLNADLCWLVGDSARDIQAGTQLGIKSIITPSARRETSPFALASLYDLSAATDFILKYR